MKKAALIFVLSVVIPSLVLAWMALRSLRDQQYVLERQQSLLFQNVADTLAKSLQDAVAAEETGFAAATARIVATTNSLRAVASIFDARLRTNYPLAKVGFVVSLDGEILAPNPNRADSTRFLADNGRFLGNREAVPVYWNTKNAFANFGASQAQQVFSPGLSGDSRPTAQSAELNQQRVVVPQQYLAVQQAAVSQPPPQQEGVQNLSRLTPSQTEFRELVGEASQGTLARFVDNRLNLLFWSRPQPNTPVVFGAQVDLPRLIDMLRPQIVDLNPAIRNDVCVSLLDDHATPLALSRPGFAANWKRPFVASEIGEALPHWEVAIYLVNPARFTESARVLKLTLGLIIAILILSIAVGSWLVFSDVRRQLVLARQKTDFVGNVSHELKTPLTSIRMFSELLAQGRVADPEKQRAYFRIITAETARLTRLINNVLDFARIERGEKKYTFREFDLTALVAETADTFQPHLHSNGYTFQVRLPDKPILLRGDRDALAQIIVNLLSNAEKYSDSAKQIELSLSEHTGPLPCAEILVEDRGLGVPSGAEEKIFDQFYRAHDELSNGIQGSGLGLTLARQIARAHGGDVLYRPRPGGGSCFSLRLPLAGTQTASASQTTDKKDTPL